MNKVFLSGRPTADPEIRMSQGDNAMKIARYRLAVDRRFKKNEQPEADFINCVAFGKSAEFAEKYIKKGRKYIVSGRIQTGSYDKDGVRHYTTDVIVEDQEFADSKNTDSNTANTAPAPSAASNDGFMNIPEGVEDELPFI